jgi:hypothetical protein
MKILHAAVLLSLFAMELAAVGNTCAAGQASPDTPEIKQGSITVLAEGSVKTRANMAVTIRLSSLAFGAEQWMTVENFSKITLRNLNPDKYRVLVTTPGREPARMDVNLSAEPQMAISVMVDLSTPTQLTLRRDPRRPLDPALVVSSVNLLNSDERSTESVSSESCPGEKVLPRVALNARELVENVNRFTAVEALERERLNQNGKMEQKAVSKSKYVATIQKEEEGVFVVAEYRDVVEGVRTFPGSIEATGALALALIFHPSHFEEFDMTCEGLTDWRGHSAWLVRFQQRKDRRATMSGFRAGKDFFPILLKGTAWIDTNNYQILHIESDLLQPIPEVKLDLEHQSVDYGSVAFNERDTSLWLPQFAEVTVHYRGKRLVDRHIYSNYRLFFVETGQTIGQPKESLE